MASSKYLKSWQVVGCFCKLRWVHFARLRHQKAFFIQPKLSRSGIKIECKNIQSWKRSLVFHYEYCCPHRVAGCSCPHRGTVGSELWPSMSMSIRFGRAVLALLSPEPSGLSQLLPGDELRVRDREPSFQGSALILAGVGRGRGANSSVLGLSRGLMRGAGSGMGGAGALRRWGTGKTVEGLGRRGMSRVSCVPEESQREEWTKKWFIQKTAKCSVAPVSNVTIRSFSLLYDTRCVS